MNVDTRLVPVVSEPLPVEERFRRNRVLNTLDSIVRAAEARDTDAVLRLAGELQRLV